MTRHSERRALDDESCNRTRVQVRRLEWVDREHIARIRSVHCPFDQTSRPIAACRACPHHGGAEGEDVVVCRRKPLLCAEDATELLARRAICTGRNSLTSRVRLGEMSAPHLVCTSRDTSVADASARTITAGAMGCIVVDDGHRPVGFVSSWTLGASTPRDAWLPVTEVTADPFLVMPEEASLADAIARLTQEHQRIVVTTDVHGRATGLVTDLALLRWMADMKRGRA